MQSSRVEQNIHKYTKDVEDIIKEVMDSLEKKKDPYEKELRENKPIDKQDSSADDNNGAEVFDDKNDMTEIKIGRDGINYTDEAHKETQEMSNDIVAERTGREKVGWIVNRAMESIRMKYARHSEERDVKQNEENMALEKVSAEDNNYIPPSNIKSTNVEITELTRAETVYVPLKGGKTTIQEKSLEDSIENKDLQKAPDHKVKIEKNEDKEKSTPEQEQVGEPEMEEPLMVLNSNFGKSGGDGKNEKVSKEKGIVRSTFMEIDDRIDRDRINRTTLLLEAAKNTFVTDIRKGGEEFILTDAPIEQMPIMTDLEEEDKMREYHFVDDSEHHKINIPEVAKTSAPQSHNGVSRVLSNKEEIGENHILMKKEFIELVTPVSHEVVSHELQEEDLDKERNFKKEYIIVQENYQEPDKDKELQAMDREDFVGVEDNIKLKDRKLSKSALEEIKEIAMKESLTQQEGEIEIAPYKQEETKKPEKEIDDVSLRAAFEMNTNLGNDYNTGGTIIKSTISLAHDAYQKQLKEKRLEPVQEHELRSKFSTPVLDKDQDLVEYIQYPSSISVTTNISTKNSNNEDKNKDYQEVVPSQGKNILDYGGNLVHAQAHSPVIKSNPENKEKSEIGNKNQDLLEGKKATKGQETRIKNMGTKEKQQNYENSESKLNYRNAFLAGKTSFADTSYHEDESRVQDYDIDAAFGRREDMLSNIVNNVMKDLVDKKGEANQGQDYLGNMLSENYQKILHGEDYKAEIGYDQNSIKNKNRNVERTVSSSLSKSETAEYDYAQSEGAKNDNSFGIVGGEDYFGSEKEPEHISIRYERPSTVINTSDNVRSTFMHNFSPSKVGQNNRKDEHYGLKDYEAGGDDYAAKHLDTKMKDSIDRYSQGADSQDKDFLSNQKATTGGSIDNLSVQKTDQTESHDYNLNRNEMFLESVDKTQKVGKAIASQADHNYFDGVSYPKGDIGSETGGKGEEAVKSVITKGKDHHEDQHQQTPKTTLEVNRIKPIRKDMKKDKPLKSSEVTKKASGKDLNYMHNLKNRVASRAASEDISEQHAGSFTDVLPNRATKNAKSNSDIPIANHQQNQDTSPTENIKRSNKRKQQPSGLDQEKYQQEEQLHNKQYRQPQHQQQVRQIVAVAGEGDDLANKLEKQPAKTKVTYQQEGQDKQQQVETKQQQQNIQHMQDKQQQQQTESLLHDKKQKTEEQFAEQNDHKNQLNRLAPALRAQVSQLLKSQFGDDEDFDIKFAFNNNVQNR